ncbi:hypothetical protein [Streptomyces sp. NPDC058614]|uniref:hypothetical protein n=1 Tax=Streptomyces sp. NPDC058614 TaxID=3346557 RepID=UPI0036608AE7
MNIVPSMKVLLVAELAWKWGMLNALITACRSRQQSEVRDILDRCARREYDRMWREMEIEDFSYWFTHRGNWKELERLAERFPTTKYHAAYCVYPEETRHGDEIPFLTEFFGALHELTGDVMDIHFQSEDLHQIGGRSIRDLAPLELTLHIRLPREDALVIWPSPVPRTIRSPRERARILKLGRFTPRTRVAAIATLVTRLEQEPLRDAVKAAQTEPLDGRGRAAPHLPTGASPGDPIARQWIAELERRHLRAPEAGYQEAAQIIKELLCHSEPRRLYAAKRIGTIVLALTAAATFTNTWANDVPDTWNAIYGVYQHVISGTEEPATDHPDQPKQP